MMIMIMMIQTTSIVTIITCHYQANLRSKPAICLHQAFMFYVGLAFVSLPWFASQAEINLEEYHVSVANLILTMVKPGIGKY